MVNFDEVKKGYKKEQVNEYINTVSSEYELLHEELKNAKAEIEVLKETGEKLEKEIEHLNSDEYATHKNVIASAIMSAEVSGLKIVEEARKEAASIEANAKEEFNTLMQDKQKAVEDVRALTEKLRKLLDEERQSTEMYGTGTTHER